MCDFSYNLRNYETETTWVVGHFWDPKLAKKVWEDLQRNRHEGVTYYVLLEIRGVETKPCVEDSCLID